MRQKYILLIIIGITLLGISAAAQSHLTLVTGESNLIIYGEQHTFIPGYRVGLDYRYDFLRGKGFGIETGFYYRFWGRRYSKNILGTYQNRRDEDIYDDTEFIQKEFLYCVVRKKAFLLPIHVTYTHLFYKDWSITGFLGVSLEYFPRLEVAKYDQVRRNLGAIIKNGRTYACQSADFPVEFGLAGTYKHLQMKIGASFGGIRIDDEELRYDGSEVSYPYSNPLSLPAELYLTVGYRF